MSLIKEIVDRNVAFFRSDSFKRAINYPGRTVSLANDEWQKKGVINTTGVSARVSEYGEILFVANAGYETYFEDVLNNPALIERKNYGFDFVIGLPDFNMPIRKKRRLENLNRIMGRELYAILYYSPDFSDSPPHSAVDAVKLSKLRFNEIFSFMSNQPKG